MRDVALRADVCQRCNVRTVWRLVTPQVGAGGTVGPACDGCGRRLLASESRWHFGGRTVCSRACIEVVAWPGGRPAGSVLEAPPALNIPPELAPMAPAAAPVGQPFGVEIKPMDTAVVAGLWSLRVRDAAGVEAFVSVGLPSQDAARWAALSWLRGQARSVANADAAALRDAFASESLKIEAPAPAVVECSAAPDGDLLAAVHARPDLEPGVFDALRRFAKDREAAWEDLADDEDAAPYTVALAKDLADRELCRFVASLPAGGQ